MRKMDRGTPIVRVALAAAALASMALIAGTAQSTADTAHPYAYLKTRGTHLGTSVYDGRVWSVYQPEVVEQWIGEDGSGRQHTVSRAPRFVSSQDRRAWEEAGRPAFLAHGFNPHTSDEFFPAGTFGEDLREAELLSSMPLDPAALSKWLLDRVGDPDGAGAGNGFPDSVKILELVTELLQNPLASSDQRAALCEAVALVPGIEDLGGAHDEIGRRGIALGAQSDNSGAPTLYSLIFNPGNSQILGSEEKWLAAPAAMKGLDMPLVVSSTAYLSEGLTPSRLSRLRARHGHHRR